MSDPIDPERVTLLVDHVLRLVQATANGDPDLVPDDIGDLSGAEEWSMTVTLVRLIIALSGLSPTADRPVTVRVNTKQEPLPHMLLSARLISTTANDDDETALALWRATTPEIAQDTVLYLIQFAAGLWREKQPEVL